MRQALTTLGVVLAGLLALPAHASATATLTLKRADRAAQDYVFGDALSLAVDLALGDSGATGVEADLGRCDRLSRTAFACDYSVAAVHGRHTMWRRPGTVEVRLRRGHAHAAERRYVRVVNREGGNT